MFGFPEVEIPVQGHGTQFLKRINRHKRRKEIEWRLALQGGRNREQQTQAVQVQPEFSQLFLRPGFPLLVPHRPDSNQGQSNAKAQVTHQIQDELHLFQLNSLYLCFFHWFCWLCHTKIGCCGWKWERKVLFFSHKPGEISSIHPV